MAPFGQSPLCMDTGKHQCRHYWERMSHQASVFIPIFLQMVSQPQISVPELSFFFFKVSLDNGLDFFFFFCSFLQEEWTIHLYSVQMAIADLVISTPLMEVDFFFLLLIWGWGEKWLKQSLTIFCSINANLQGFVLLLLGCNCLNHGRQRRERGNTLILLIKICLWSWGADSGGEVLARDLN